MGYIESGKQQGATVHTGGVRYGSEGYFVTPTIFTNVKPDMKIVQEEIFGPVGVVIKFKDEAGVFENLFYKVVSVMYCSVDVIEQANASVYGLASAVFTQNINTAISVANSLESGSVFVRFCSSVQDDLPFNKLFVALGELRNSYG